MSNSPVAFPPLDGSIPVIPGFVDFQAQHNGDRPWVMFPSGSPVESLSYAQYCEATNRIAWTLCPDGARAKGEVVAIIINCDSALYLALLSGLIRAGYVPFPMSPKNSVPAFASMLRKTGCRHIISQAAFDPVIAGIQLQLADERINIKVDTLPALHDIFPQFAGGHAAPVTSRTFPPPSKPNAPDDLVLYLHSSGSTGFPKPIPQRQRSVLQWCSGSILLETRKRGVVWGSMPLPTFHTIGVYMQWYMPLVTGFPVGLYHPTAPAPPPVPSPASYLAACRATGTTGITVVPVFIEAWAQDKESVQYLASLDILAYSGGPLSRATGDALVAAGVRLCAIYGGTEHGVPTKTFDIDFSSSSPDARTKGDWEYVAFVDDAACRWAPQGDGTFELQLLTREGYAPAVENLLDTRGYATSDLFVPHPMKTGLWKITGRKDDVLVLSTGEKVVPIPQEGALTASPLVSGAIVFGHARTACGVIIEPHPDCTIDPNDPLSLGDFRERIWPVVEQANALAPSFARVLREMVLVAHPDRPFPRAAKGTVVRPQVLQLYAAEIESLYSTLAASAATDRIAPPTTWCANDVGAWLARYVEAIHRGEAIDPSRDIFNQGFDSLQASALRNRIVGTMRASPEPAVQGAAQRVPPSIVYDHPSLHALASAVASTVSPSPQVEAHDRAAGIKAMLAKYTRAIPELRRHPRCPCPQKIVVLLTGATGTLGAPLLSALLGDARVARVYALVRGHDVRARLAAAFEERDLPMALMDSAKCVPLAGDVSAEGMGLEDGTLEELRANVTVVIHCAWRLDFNLSLASFEPHIASTAALVDFCARASRHVRLLFASSVAAGARWDTERGAVPEVVLADPNDAAPSGYASSKFVAEHIVAQAARQGLEAVSLRIGQVCGAKGTGAWATTEWVPIVVKSSIALGMMPELEGVVSWIPVDAVTTAMVDLVTVNGPLPEVVNVVHPRPAQWTEIFEAIGWRVGKERLRTVPFKEWLCAVENVAIRERVGDLERVPAVKILQFLRDLNAGADRLHAGQGALMEAGGIPIYKTENLRRLCPSIDALEPLGEAHARAWVDYWKRRRFLSLPDIQAER